MPDPYTFCSPLSVPVSSKKKFILNINNMATTHYRVKAKAKRVYTKMMRHLLSDSQMFDDVSINFVLFPKTRRMCDLDNVCGAHAKFSLDALQEWGVLEDDNYNFVRELHYYFGEIDRDNPRVEITLSDYVSDETKENKVKTR